MKNTLRTREIQISGHGLLPDNFTDLAQLNRLADCLSGNGPILMTQAAYDKYSALVEKRPDGR